MCNGLKITLNWFYLPKIYKTLGNFDLKLFWIKHLCFIKVRKKYITYSLQQPLQRFKNLILGTFRFFTTKFIKKHFTLTWIVKQIKINGLLWL